MGCAVVFIAVKGDKLDGSCSLGKGVYKNRGGEDPTWPAGQIAEEAMCPVTGEPAEILASHKGQRWALTTQWLMDDSWRPSPTGCGEGSGSKKQEKKETNGIKTNTTESTEIRQKKWRRKKCK